MIEQTVHHSPKIWLTAAIIGSITSILAFQTNRLEVYESEKFFLLSAFACVIFGGLLLKLIYEPRSLSAIRNPVTVGVLLVLASTILSTMASISFTQSLFGSHARSHGAIVWLIYAILFVGAVVASESLRPLIVPTIVSVSIPLCTWALVEHGDDSEFFRNGSTTGNAIFLSSWIIIALPVLLHDIIARYWHSLHNPQTSNMLMTGLTGVSVALMVVTLLGARSRGALFALLATSIFCGLFWLALRKKHSALLISTFVLGILFALGLRSGRPYEQISTSSQTRMLVLEDPFRENIWSRFSNVLSRPTLVDICDVPDRFSASRSIVGFGPESMEFLGFETLNGQYVDRFHNVFYDTMFTHGILGVFAFTFLFIAAVGWSLRRMNVLRTRHAAFWVITAIFSVLVAVQGMRLILPLSLQFAYLPIGIVVGLLGNLVVVAYISNSRSQLEITSLHHMTYLAIVLVHLIDLQFSFFQMASDSLWWIVLGVYVGLSRSSSSEKYFSAEVKHYHWEFVTLATGLVTIHSWLNFSDSELVFVDDKWNGFGLLMLVLIVAVGFLGAYFSTRNIENHRLIKRMLIIIGVFLSMTVVKFIMQKIAGNGLEQGVLGFSENLIRYPYLLMSLSGIIFVIGVLSGFLILSEAPKSLPRLTTILIIGTSIAAGIVFYAGNYNRAASHRLATELAADDTYYLEEVSVKAFQQATSFGPPSLRVLMDWIYLDMRRRATPDYDWDNEYLVEHLQRTNHLYPFHNVTAEWELFAAAAEDPRLYYEEYICYPDQEF